MTLLSATPVTDTDFLHEYAETRRYLAGRPVSAKVTPDGKTVLFLRGGAKDPRLGLFELDLATGAAKELVTPDQVLNGASETLSAAEKARLERQRVSARGFTSYQLSADGANVLLGLSGKLYVFERASRKVTPLKTGEGACLDPKFSPDGKSVAYVRANDVRIIELAKNVEKSVTTGGTELKPHGLAEFAAQEEMDRFTGYWFSPDSKSIVYEAIDHTGMEVFRVADPMHPESEGEPFFYPRAGKQNAAVALWMVGVGGGKAVELKWDHAAFPYLGRVAWAGGPPTVLVLNREQTKEQVLAFDEKTGAAKELLTETDEAWVNMSRGIPFWWKDHGFFWTTERNGGWEVELRKPDGTLDASWVKPAAGFQELAGFDPSTETLFFFGGADPTRLKLFKVTKAGEPVEVPTGGDVNLGEVSGGGWLVVSSTSADAMPTTRVMKQDGSGAVQLPSVAVEPSLKLSLEVLQPVKDGPWAAVIRPSNFKAGQKYPVILQVYGGPHHLEVLRVKRENLLLQWLANQGFVVVKLDGRGTPGRGRAWERAIAKDFATNIVADQVSTLQALGKKYPELDLARVGVYGWSFGGYLAGLLTMSKGDVFKSGIAGAPVVDWRDYDTCYTERYLGVPDAQPKAYEVSSLLTYVKDSKRPLLLIHGTADDNVYFLHTLKLSDALFRAGKPHSVLPLTNFTHMVADPLVNERLYERIATWFKETL
ncbi:MAG: DPP IV N-terminal domain-containing protein [Myxococcaceae bacterium]